MLRYALGSAAVAALIASSAQAAVVFSDNFDTYTNGNLNGQGTWVQTSGTGTGVQVASGTASLGASGPDNAAPFTSAVAVATPSDSGLDTSYTLTVSTANATGDYFQHLGNTSTGTGFYQRVFAKTSGTGYVLGLVDASGTGSTPTYGSTVLAFGTSYAIDIKWNFVAGANNDTFALTVDAASYLTHTWTSTSVAEPTSVAAVNLRQGSTTPAAIVDDYVVSTVVPEPTSLALLGLGGLGLMRRRR